MSLENVETAFLFSAMMFPGKLFNYTSALLGNLWMFWLVSASVYAGVRLGAGRVRGNHFACYFLSLFLSLSAYLYNLACAVLPRFFGETNQGYTLAFVGTAAAAAGVLELICLGIRGRFGEPLKRLNQLGKRYGAVSYTHLTWQHFWMATDATPPQPITRTLLIVRSPLSFIFTVLSCFSETVICSRAVQGSARAEPCRPWPWIRRWRLKGGPVH